MPRPFSNSGYKPPVKTDPRNYLLEKAQPMQPFPTPYKTDTSMIPRLMQGDRSACVEHAVAKALMYKEFKNTGIVTLLSPRFLAALTVKADGFPLSEGTSLEKALKLARQYGICEEKYFPNDVTLSDADYCDLTKITPEAYANALTHRISTYAFVSDISANGLHNAVYQNEVLVMGMKICSSWWTDLKGAVTWLAFSILPLRPPVPHDTTISGHCILYHGYDATYEYIDNGWSENWGDKGYGWFGANDRPFVYECATIVDLTPAQIQKVQQSDQIVNTIDNLQKVENSQNKNLILSLISQLWAKFTSLWITSNSNQ